MRTFNSSLFTEIYEDVEPIAMIGAGCRFMGATDPFTFWRRLADGEELSRRVTEEDLVASGLDPELLKRDNFVPVASVIDEVDHFDASLFGYSPAEAASIDPQQRLFLTCCWEALDMAGLGSTANDQRVGVFGSARMSTYSLAQPEDVLSAGLSRTFQKLIGNDKDYLATRVAYKLGLTGPALTVQTACSSSLVAVHIACEQLRSGECDLALAGGAALTFPMAAGYFYQQGMIFSPDGTCRPFDADAAGTFIGNGVGAVLLKPLRRALEDGDGILAVIRGSAVNNDGDGKAGFTAPSLGGQQAVVEEAMALAGVTPEQIGMVETHGTATPLGDPIEVHALAEAFGRDVQRERPCALGALKANTGHLDTAAGIAALIKAAFSVKTGLIAPCLHFREPNPALEIDNTPFNVPQTLQTWSDEMRVAGVSSFGIGGTNCHLIVENLPEELKRTKQVSDGEHHLALSAPDFDALCALAQNHSDLLLEGEFEGELTSYCDTLSQRTATSGARLEISGRDGLDLARKLALFSGPDGEANLKRCEGENGVTLWIENPDATRVSTASRVPRVCAPIAPRIGQVIARQRPGSEQGDGWNSVVSELVEASQLHAAEHDWSTLKEEEEAVARLHAIYVAHAFDNLGVFAEGACRTVAQVMEAGNILPQLAQLTERLLRDLAEEGALDCIGNGVYGNLRVVPLEESEEPLRDMAKRGYIRLTDMVARVGPHLSEMLTGTVDPVSLVFPSAAMDDVEDMYERQRDSIFLNDLAADSAAAVVAALPTDATIRVLEIGAGTGGTTSSLLPVLPANRTRYTFTDIGPLFLHKAREKFEAYPFLDFATLDIEKDLITQGFVKEGYDLIVAANVLHNGRDLTRVFSDVRRLLRPGGVLLMREISEPKPLFDFVFGPLVPVLDDIKARGGELFPSLECWGNFLTDAGFSNWASFPPEKQQEGAIGETIILARNGAPVKRASKSAGFVEAKDPAGLLAALAVREGEGFWRFDAVRIGQSVSDALVAAQADTVIAGTGEPNSIGIAAHRSGLRVLDQPPVPVEDMTGFSGGLDVALRQALEGFAGDSEEDFAIDAVSGTASDLSTGRFHVIQRDGGGVDVAIFDDNDWPVFWIENFRPVQRSISGNAQLYQWHWDATDLPSFSETAAAAVMTPETGLYLPTGNNSGKTYVVDLSEIEQNQPAAPLYAALANLIHEAAQIGCKLVIITRGAYCVVPWDASFQPLAAGVAGLVRVATQEYPDLHLQLVDDDGSHSREGLERAIVASGADGIFALRRGRCFVPRLVPANAPTTLKDIGYDGTHLLIGGLSPMALATAEWLAGRGARLMCLVARREPTAQERTRLAALEEAGVKIELKTDVDLSDIDAVGRFFDDIAGTSIASVFHFAGHLEDGPIADLNETVLERVLAPKLLAAGELLDRLHTLKPGRVVFASSAATVFGPPGQAAHAIANAVLEGVAEAIRAKGVPSTALAWGMWQDERVERSDLADRLAGTGMLAMSRSEALELMGAAFSLNAGTACPARVDWQVLSDAAGGALPLSFAHLVPAIASKTDLLEAAAGDLASTETWLAGKLGSLLGLTQDKIDFDEKLLGLGVDSLMMLELAQSVKNDLDVELPADFALQDQTASSLANYLWQAGGQAQTSKVGSDIETRVIALIAELLLIDTGEVRLDSRLLDLGFDSLLFLDFAERLASETGIRLSGETAMSFDTVNSLVEALKEQGSATKVAEKGSLQASFAELKTSRADLFQSNGDLAPMQQKPGLMLPLSPLQQAWWRGRQVDAPLGGIARHMYVEYDKDATTFDLDAFEMAWKGFVRRHPALRMSIAKDGQTVVTEPAEIPPVARDDFRELNGKVLERRLSEIRCRMSDQTFDLASWPFFEWRASLLPDNRIRLHFDIDTTFIDIESFQVMLRELGRCVAEPGRVLPPLAFTACDYMRGMSLVEGTEVSRQAVSGASERFAALPAAPDLPILAMPEDIAPNRFTIERRALDRKSWLTVRDAALESGVSGTALVLASFAVALRSWSPEGQGFSLQLAYPDRKPLHAEAMNIACEASAAMAVPFDFSGEPTFLEMMRATEGAIRENLSPVLCGGLVEAQASEKFPTLCFPVAMTSLLGVRQAYQLPESADPLLGMPTYEYATQPQMALHFQVLEEERELLCNIDEFAGLFPEGLAASVFDVVMHLLDKGESCWSEPVSRLVVSTGAQDTGFTLRSWLKGLRHDG